MEKEERIALLHALMKADNAFHASLRESGYTVSYGLDDTRTGSVHKVSRNPTDTWPLADLTIKWKLRDAPKGV